MNKLVDLIKKYKSVISYLFFGVCTTLVNMVCYYVCYNISGIPNVPATVIAWVVAVVFAYITNKLFVFDSKSFKADILIKEVAAFLGCRLLTGILDIATMYVAVDLLNGNSTLWKLLSNIIVIILNYIASRLLIFKGNKQTT